MGEKSIINGLIRCDHMLQDHERRLNKLEVKKPRLEVEKCPECRSEMVGYGYARHVDTWVCSKCGHEEKVKPDEK